jgi:hypothetical protein
VWGEAFPKTFEYALHASFQINNKTMLQEHFLNKENHTPAEVQSMQFFCRFHEFLTGRVATTAVYSPAVLLKRHDPSLSRCITFAINFAF